MEKQPLLDKAKDLIAEGNTDQAMELVESFLANKPEYKLLHRESLHLSSLFFKTKQDQAKRTISFENAELNYGKVREGLFNLLDFIEKDNLNPEGLLSDKPSSKQSFLANKWLLLIVLPLIVLTIAVLLIVNKLGGNKSNSEECKVAFENPNSKNFLVLPFYKPSGGDAKPEGLFIGRLEEFCAGIESLKNAGFQQCENYAPNKLLSFDQAAKIGTENKATIVLWGLTDQNGKETFVKTRFKYLGGKDKDGKVPFTRLSQDGKLPALEGEQAVATDKVLSIITSSGEMTSSIETTLMLMFGMVANLEGDREGAIKAMQSANVEGDSSANLLKYMVLADNFIAKGESNKAKAALDTCLNVNNNYWLGRNNRANLRMESGDYLGAIEDLTVALTKRPDDAEMLVARGMAFKQSQQLNEAKADFEKAARINPKNEPKLRKTIDETNVEIKRLERIVAPTKSGRANTLSKQQYILAAEASNKLGDYANSNQLLAKGLEIDRDNPKLIAIQVDNYLKEKDEVNAKQILKSAIGRNVKKDEIAKHSPNVASFIKTLNANNELRQ